MLLLGIPAKKAQTVALRPTIVQELCEIINIGPAAAHSLGQCYSLHGLGWEGNNKK